MTVSITNLGKFIGGVITEISSSGIFTKRDVASFKKDQFLGGNVSYGSLYEAVASMSSTLPVFVGASNPGTLTINSVPLGNYEYSIFGSPVTISSGWTNTDYFTTTKDTISSFVVVKGNMTIDSGQTFIPPDRKLFLCLYVTGNLTVNGVLSMTARGANHSGSGNSGGLTTEGNILIVSGTVLDHTNATPVTNFIVSGTGGAGGAGSSSTPDTPSCPARTVTGTPGPSSGPTAASGGGGAGANANSGASSGGGAPGTCFTGGTGGGGVNGGSTPAPGGTPRGGAGGPGIGPNSNSGGGAGNPGGSGPRTGGTGTGGTIIIFCDGTIGGTGTIESKGANGGGFGTFPTAGGGGSGGGCIVLCSPSGATTSTLNADGGSGDPAYSGCGGNGSIRKIALP